MNKFFGLTAMLVFPVLMSAGSGYAQSEAGVTVSLATQYPGGDFEKKAAFGYGVLGDFDIGGDNLAVTVTSGYIDFLGRGGYKTQLIPLVAGLKLSASERVVYLYGQGGAVFTTTHYSGPAVGVREGKFTNVGWSTGVGSVTGPYDLRFSFHVWDARHALESMAIGLSIGLTTWSL